MQRRFSSAIPLVRRITFEIYFAASGGGVDFAGALRDSNADTACAGILPYSLSQRPRRRKGITVAATRSFALRGTRTSGSQRNNCADRKKVRTAQQRREAREMRMMRSQMGADSKIARLRPWTR